MQAYYHFFTTMLVECCIYHGALSFPHDNIVLEDLVPYVHKFYNHRPRMVKFREAGVTLLVFTSLRYRLMGKGDQHRQVLDTFLLKLPWNCVVKEISINMTVSHQLPGHINLHKLNPQYFQTEMEIFPASRFLHEGKENINIFHTGRIIFTGVRDMHHVEMLIDKILMHISSAMY